jgi:type IV pilus assembly protein PilB
VTTHTTADAFVRKLLERPTDATARLVFADWLEETGDKRNTAWAYYMRLRTEADRYPHNSRERAELELQAAGYTKHIRAELAIPAAKFVGYPKSLLQLLPAPNITVRLDGFDPPRAVVEFLPESVARENILFPLDHQPGTLLLAGAEPWNADTLQKLQFILNRDIVLVRADATDIQDAIDRTFGATETLSVDSVLYEFTDPAQSVLYDDPQPLPSHEQVAALTNLILTEAVSMRADGATVEPDTAGASVYFEIDGARVERDRLPEGFVRPVAERIAVLANINPDVALPDVPPVAHMGIITLSEPTAVSAIVRIEPTLFGPRTEMEFDRGAAR